MTTLALAAAASANAPTNYLAGPTDGDTWWVLTDRMRVVVPGDQTGGAYAVAINDIPPGGGPPPHMHRNEDELFYIIKGQLLWTLGDRQYQGVAGDVVFLPRGIPHTFQNNGDSPTRFLLIATPSGFEKFVASVGDAADPAGPVVPPPFTEAALGRVIAGAAAAGIQIIPDYVPGPLAELPRHRETLSVLGHRVDLKLTGDQSDGRFTVAELVSPPGAGIPPHRHAREDELFYVLEGEVTFDIEGNRHVATAGTFVRIPQGVWHAPVNTGSTPARILDIHTPGGFEGFFRECDGDDLPPDQVLHTLAKFGMEVR